MLTGEVNSGCIVQVFASSGILLSISRHRCVTLLPVWITRSAALPRPHRFYYSINAQGLSHSFSEIIGIGASTKDTKMILKTFTGPKSKERHFSKSTAEQSTRPLTIYSTGLSWSLRCTTSTCISRYGNCDEGPAARFMSPWALRFALLSPGAAAVRLVLPQLCQQFTEEVVYCTRTPPVSQSVARYLHRAPSKAYCLVCLPLWANSRVGSVRIRKKIQYLNVRTKVLSLPGALRNIISVGLTK